MFRSVKRLEVCSGTALTEVSPSWRHESKDTLWGANTPWQNAGSSRRLRLLAGGGSRERCLSTGAALFHELQQTWRETSSLENKAPRFASASAPQFPQLLKPNQRSCSGTGYPKTLPRAGVKGVIGRK